MANVTETHSNGVCTVSISTPSNFDSIVLVPKTSGNAVWTNFCTWTDTSNQGNPKNLGEWSVHLSDFTVVSNPFSLINTTTYHGTVTKTTNPAVGQITEFTLSFSHQTDKNSPIKPDELKVTTETTGPVTIVTIMGEDTYDTNFLDFDMTVIFLET